MDFIIQNWAEIVGIAGALHLLALAIVNATPSKRDNELYNRFYKVIEMFLAIVNATPSKRDNELYNRFYKVIEMFAGIVTKTAKK